ncbi:hypothetical protein [Nocardia sp. NRRL S-836]|uniref:hypothetical protein n=1 Tax=Nocardia sp. NRRL S-836 TaxID=1519492 RepID=UPI0006BFDB1A|nr:hypothetical protein [Nocardia sp. NRRL S-836]KOV86810.1 hypothetical protein ADL03_08355 [Nocardia sp. NRRL S-836]
MRADLLADAIEGLDEALAAVDGADQALAAGLVRPQAAQVAGVTGLADAVVGSPLAERVAEAAEKVAVGAAGEEHFVSLAAARVALFGSVHDAVLQRVDQATGRGRAEELVPATGSDQPLNLLLAARSWLSDLARAGWRGIDHDLVAGAAPVVSALLPVPELRRLATLLDGFAAELAASCPGSALERVPVRRWGDLWSRAVLLTLPGALRTGTTTVSGRLLPLGVDLQEHPTAAQAQVHAVLEPADGGAPLLVRASVSAPKPDSVVGAGIWQLLRPHLTLLTAVSEGRAMELTDMPMTGEGDLLWAEPCARMGEPADPFTTARVVLPTASALPTAALDRHPARIAAPVFLDGYGVEPDPLAFTVSGQRIAVDADRIPAAGPLTPEAVAASSECIGLLRWDAGTFRVQPLAVLAVARKKSVALHAGAWAGGAGTDKAGVKAEKAATDAVAVLRERAGRLLRT